MELAKNAEVLLNKLLNNVCAKAVPTMPKVSAVINENVALGFVFKISTKLVVKRIRIPKQPAIEIETVER